MNRYYRHLPLFLPTEIKWCARFAAEYLPLRQVFIGNFKGKLPYHTFLLGCVFTLLISPAYAIEDIEETLKKAHAFSPALKAAKERLDVEKERVPQALTGFQPTVTLDYAVGRQDNTLDNAQNYADVNHGALNIDQPIFNGFGDLAAYRRASLEVEAAQFDYINASQGVLLNAAVAHIHVARDQEVLEASQNNEAALRRQLNATIARRRAGTLTKTDVSQARTRLSEAIADTLDNRDRLDASMQRYRELVGELPVESLMMPQMVAGLPQSKEEALELARKQNPDIHNAERFMRAADEQIGEATSELWPDVFIRGRMERDNHSGSLRNQNSENNSITLNVTVPLYQAGQTYTDIRRSRATHRQSEQDHVVVKHRVEREVINAYHRLNAQEGIISTREDGVSQATSTLNGYRREYKAGSRSTVDLLDAERDLFRTQTALAEARANYVTTSYLLLALTGKLTDPDVAVLPLEDDAKPVILKRQVIQHKKGE